MCFTKLCSLDSLKLERSQSLYVSSTITARFNCKWLDGLKFSYLDSGLENGRFTVPLWLNCQCYSIFNTRNPFAVLNLFLDHICWKTFFTEDTGLLSILETWCWFDVAFHLCANINWETSNYSSIPWNLYKLRAILADMYLEYGWIFLIMYIATFFMSNSLYWSMSYSLLCMWIGNFDYRLPICLLSSSACFILDSSYMF